MLDEYCNIPLKHFIMAGIRDDGQLVRFTGPKEATTSEVLSKYIDLEGYQKWYTTGRVMPSTKPQSDVIRTVFADVVLLQPRVLRTKKAILRMETQLDLT